MNYLGHLYLADADPAHRLGNFIGDWIKGDIRGHALPPRVADGVRRHRLVDGLTDTHPAVVRARGRFTGRHRRVCAIALDVLWDHFLVRHWPTHLEGPLDDFLDGCYKDLLGALPDCPSGIDRRVERIIRQDWLRGYASLDDTGHALRRIGERLSRDPGLYDIIDEIRRHYPDLEQDFLDFPLVRGRQAAMALLADNTGGTLE